MAAAGPGAGRAGGGSSGKPGVRIGLLPESLSLSSGHWGAKSGEGEGRTQGGDSRGDPNKRGLSPLPNNEPRTERRLMFYSWPAGSHQLPAPATGPSTASIILPSQAILGLGLASPPPSSRPLSLPGWGWGGFLSRLRMTGQKPQVHSC